MPDAAQQPAMFNRAVDWARNKYDTHLRPMVNEVSNEYKMLGDSHKQMLLGAGIGGVSGLTAGLIGRQSAGGLLGSTLAGAGIGAGAGYASPHIMKAYEDFKKRQKNLPETHPASPNDQPAAPGPVPNATQQQEVIPQRWIDTGFNKAFDGYNSVRDQFTNRTSSVREDYLQIDAGRRLARVKTARERFDRVKHALTSKDLGITPKSTLESVATGVSDYIFPGMPFSATRSGRAAQASRAMGVEPEFEVSYPLTSSALYTLGGAAGGALLGGATGALGGGAMGGGEGVAAGGTVGAAVGGGLGASLAGLVGSYIRRKQTNDIAKTVDAGAPLHHNSVPDLSPLGLLGFLGGPHRAGQMDAYRAVRDNEPTGNSTRRNIGHASAYVPHIGLLTGPAVAGAQALQSYDESQSEKERLSDKGSKYENAEHKAKKTREKKKKEKKDDKKESSADLLKEALSQWAA